MNQTPTCGKLPYQTKAEALRYRDVLRRLRNRLHLSAYRCPECGAYHLGRRRSKGKVLR